MKRWLRKQSGLSWVDRKSTKDLSFKARYENLHVFSDWIIWILNSERAQDLLSTTIQNILVLETRQDELHILLGRTSSRVASSEHAQRKEFHVTHHSRNVLFSQYAAHAAWSGITMDTWWGDDLNLGTKPDTWGTKDRPQRQAPHSCSLVVSSNHNYLCLIDHY